MARKPLLSLGGFIVSNILETPAHVMQHPAFLEVHIAS